MNSTRELPAEYLENCPVIDERYKVLFKLGSGRFSKVRMAICLPTNQKVAIKIINQKQTEQSQVKQYNSKVLQSFLNQIEMCVKSKHKNIIKIIDFQVGGVYRYPDGSTRRILYYVMKIASNGELHRLIKQTDVFSEKFSRFLFRQLISAIQHLHNSRISHRDIKAENILIDEKFNLRLADFGCSNYFLDYQHNKIGFDPSQPVGSLKSNAPQVTNAKKQGIYHGDSLDLFACGYILFEMVMKAEPFKSSNHKDQHYRQLVQEENNNFWKIFSSTCDPSPEFKDLIQKLFDPNPNTRISLQSLKKHSWYTGQIPKKKQFRKEMNVRLKKVWAKVRKEQQEQIQAFFKKQRSKIECIKLEPIRILREFENQIFKLHELIRMKDNSDSSSCTSSADPKDLLSSNISQDEGLLFKAKDQGQPKMKQERVQ